MDTKNQGGRLAATILSLSLLTVMAGAAVAWADSQWLPLRWGAVGIDALRRLPYRLGL